MHNHTFISSFWKDFKIVKSIQTESFISITLKPNSTAKYPCGLESHAVHEYQWRCVKCAMILGVPVELCIKIWRVKCINCGIKTEFLSWLEPHARITNRVRSYIEQLRPLSSNKAYISNNRHLLAFNQRNR